MREVLEHSQWIFVQDAGQDICNSYFDYVAEFEQAGHEKVTFHVCATNLYALYVNGQFVDCGQYPGYEEYQVYDSVDITPYLVMGKNTIKLIQYVVGSNIFTHRTLKPGVIFSLWQGEKCLLNSNTECLSRVNPNYQRGQMEQVSPQLGFVFRYDASVEETPYQKSILADKRKALYSRPIKKLPIEEPVTGVIKNQGVFLESASDKPIGRRMQDSYLAACRKTELFKICADGYSWSLEEEKLADGVYVIIDTQEECTGFLNLDFEVPEECEVLIAWGEHLEDLRVRSIVGSRNFCVSYHAKAGKNHFFQPFLRLGMRYMQIHIYSKKGAIYQSGVRRTWYPLTVKENTLNDALHQKIYDVGVHTLQLCMHEHYEDCPWREQALYSFDSRIQMLCGYYAFEEYEFAKASIRLMALSLREDGLLELCAPGKENLTIPSFTAVFVRQVYEYLLYSNDIEFGHEIFEVVYKVVKGFEERISENDLIACYVGEGYWNFYDWKDGLDGIPDGQHMYHTGIPPYECPFNAIVSDAISCFAKICHLLGREEESYYGKLHERMNGAIHKNFYDEKRQLYITQLGKENQPMHAYTQALVLYAGAVPSQYEEAVLSHMLDENMIPCSLSTSIYEFDVLLQKSNRYREYVWNKIGHNWQKMLYEGATTFWEVEEGEAYANGAGSLCHGWSAVPVYIYKKYFEQ